MKIYQVLFCGALFLASWKRAEGQSYKCDESKCRGQRIHPWVDDDTEYTCWVKAPAASTSDSTIDSLTYELQMADLETTLHDPLSGYCADGYVGKLVKSVPQQVIDGELRSWYTCCPPDSEYAGLDGSSKEVYQTCSDTACSSPDWAGGGNCWADGFQEPMSCGDSKFRFPRYTGLQSLIYVQFVCCDSPQEDDAFMEDLLLARVIWIILSTITIVVCSFFIAAIWRKKDVRSDGYNLYLIFLAVPDALANLMVLVRNALAISGAPISPTAFIFLASFEYFYAASNMYLNAVIVRQIHNVLLNSNKDVTVPPPSTSLVRQQTGIVYAFSTIFFGWNFFLYIHGLNVFSLDTIVNVWISTRAVMVAPAMFYVLYICWDVYFNNRLPISGRTRVLALYFLRVIIVFLCTWVPYFILYEVAWNVTHSRWMVYCSYYLGSVQGTVSVMVALSKPDVRQACLDFAYAICCYKPTTKPNIAITQADDCTTEEPQDCHVEKEEHDTLLGRIFGGKAEYDDLWNQDDVWATDDLLEAVIAGEIPVSAAVPTRHKTEAPQKAEITRLDTSLSDNSSNSDDTSPKKNSSDVEKSLLKEANTISGEESNCLDSNSNFEDSSPNQKIENAEASIVREENMFLGEESSSRGENWIQNYSARLERQGHLPS